MFNSLHAACHFSLKLRLTVSRCVVSNKTKKAIDRAVLTSSYVDTGGEEKMTAATLR